MFSSPVCHHAGGVNDGGARLHVVEGRLCTEVTCEGGRIWHLLLALARAVASCPAHSHQARTARMSVIVLLRSYCCLPSTWWCATLQCSFLQHSVTTCTHLRHPKAPAHVGLRSGWEQRSRRRWCWMEQHGAAHDKGQGDTPESIRCGCICVLLRLGLLDPHPPLRQSHVYR